MAQNTSANEPTAKNKKTIKSAQMKFEGKKKKTKNNFYSSFKLGIPEHSSEEEDDTTPIKYIIKKKLQLLI